jgi:hypothetical protein
MYMAFLCYTFDKSADAVIKFNEPDPRNYAKVIPIQFNVLHNWSKQDEDLYHNQ